MQQVSANYFNSRKLSMSWKLPLTHYAKRLVMIDHQLGDEDHHLERYITLGRALDRARGG